MQVRNLFTVLFAASASAVPLTSLLATNNNTLSQLNGKPGLLSSVNQPG